MEEMARHGKVGHAAMRAGMDRKTGRKYLRERRLPSELNEARTWRTRPDPFEADWADIAVRLKDAPELEGKALFEDLLERRPGSHDPGQLRTFQRRLHEWRAREGPPKEVFFPQLHRAGEAMQTDFTWATELLVTIAGEPFPHMFCHAVLPYSNWEWATVCHSESMSALRRGVQAAAFRLGRVPEFHQTDNSTAATHDLATGKRGFNSEYVALMRHLGMTARTIEIGKSNQNGDVEALNGALKRRLLQHLILRCSRDFESVAAYEAWVQEIVERTNRQREKRVAEELNAMRPLSVERLPEHREERALVSPWSTIRVKFNTYSVPARLIGERVSVHVYDDRLEVLHGGRHELTTDRLSGRGSHRINYRHVIWSLVKKPWAFARYRYRDELFPSPAFRRAYDALLAALPDRQADIEYLRILHLAASTLEADVEAALALMEEARELPRADAVKGLVVTARAERAVPELTAPVIDLAVYDALLFAEVA